MKPKSSGPSASWRSTTDRRIGLLRSLIVYWRPGRQKGLERLYRDFVQSGDLVFDVGAHLGDRTAAFQSLGARVIALEPQADVRRWLERLVGRRSGVTIRAEAVGREPGIARMAVSRRNPTVSSLADGWTDELPGANAGFRSVRWEERVEVPVTTLDRLIEEYGVPAFCKIDVEGFEAEVLAGLTRPLRGLSIEFVAGALHVATECVRRLALLGDYELNAVRGERREFEHARWMTATEMEDWLAAGADGLPSGDVYARLRSSGKRDV